MEKETFSKRPGTRVFMAMGHSRLPLSSRKSVFCSPSSPSFYRAPPCMQKSDGDDPRRDATSPPLDGDAICMRARNFSFPSRVGRGNKWGRRCRVFRPSVLVRRRPIKSLSRRQTPSAPFLPHFCLVAAFIPRDRHRRTLLPAETDQARSPPARNHYPPPPRLLRTSETEGGEQASPDCRRNVNIVNAISLPLFLHRAPLLGALYRTFSPPLFGGSTIHHRDSLQSRASR